MKYIKNLNFTELSFSNCKKMMELETVLNSAGTFQDESDTSGA